MLSCHLMNTLCILHVGSAPRIVRIRSADEQTIVALFGQNSDVVVTVIFRLALHQAQLRVPVPGVPLDPLVHVLRQVRQADVINNVSRSNQKRVSILIQQFEMVCVSLISKESLNISYNNYRLDTELSSFAY